ncbi:MAG: hypothetical protein M3460_28270 [Actinomycetota bacterium]|nr:hypothetical protein [Actinomycetota bacterium]
MHAIVVSFGDQLPRVGVGQRFRISTELPDVDKTQTPPRPVPAELGSTPARPAPGNTDDRKTNRRKDIAT